MERTAVAGGRIGGLGAVTRYQWLVFLVVWLGWTLDAADFGLYSLVLRPALTELLGGVGSSRVDLQACKLEYSIVSPK